VLVLFSIAWLFVSDSAGLSPAGMASAALAVVLNLIFGMRFVPQVRVLSQAHPFEAMPWVDILLALGVLAFCAGHYRLQAMLHHVFPIDTRKRTSPNNEKKGTWLWRQPIKPPKAKRSAETLARREIAALALGFPLWVCLAEILWLILAVNRGNRELDLSLGLWQTIVLTWIIGVGMLTVGFFLNYLSLQKRSSQEGLLACQDLLWQETRQEQSRVARRLAWIYRRGQR